MALPVLRLQHTERWAMSFLEKRLESYANHLAEELGYLHIKVSPAGQRGWPDHVFINRNGVHVYVEFKAPGGKVTVLQSYRCKQLRDRHVAIYEGVDSKQEVARILKEWENANCEYF